MADDCPSRDVLLAFHVGKLAEEGVEAVGRHLEQCPCCAAALEQMDGAADPVLAALLRPGPSTESVAAGALPRTEPALPSAAEWPRLPGYEVLAPLGRGGMGVVYKARQVGLNRWVALKELRAGDARELARARTEAEALARLQHPNVVQIHEVIEHDGRAYLALELVEGGPLAAHLTGKPQRPRETAVLLHTLARAAEYAHAQGIVHRDLKPANILLAENRNEPSSFLSPKIADFGLAKVLATDVGQTREGDVMGTPSYMAPEQAGGRVGEIGPATDVYGLGVILYEMLTGRVPFQGVSAIETLLLVCTEEPVPPRQLQPKVPRDLETICLKCLQKEPHRRYAGAGLLADDLGRFLAGEPIRARPTPTWERVWKAARRRPAVAGLSAAVVLVVAATLVLVSWQWQKAEGRRRRAEEAEARLAFQQGQALCEQGEIGRGLLWLARSLERATSAGATTLDRPLRINLAEWGRQLRPPGPTLAHPTHVLSLAFDPTGRFLLAGGKDGLARFWDVAAGVEAGPALEPPRPNPGSWLGVVAFSPDGRTIATAGKGGVVLWDAATRRPVGSSLPHPERMIWGMFFFPDNKRLATCGDDGMARIWDLATRQVVVGPLRHFGPPGYYTLAVSPDGRTLVTAGQDGRVVRWDAGTGQAREPDLHHRSCVLAAAFSRDGRKLVTATRGGTLHVWDLATGQATDLPRQGAEATAVAFAPDGRSFATATGFGTVRLWHSDSLRPVGPVYRCASGVHALAFSPEGRRLAMGMGQGGIAFAALPLSLEAAPPAHLAAEVHALCYTPDGARVLAGTRIGARWLDAARGQPLGKELTNPENFDIDATMLSPDGASLAMGRWSGVPSAWRGRVELWDRAGGQRRWQTADHAAPVATVAYSADGRTLFSCSRADFPQGGSLWEVNSGKHLRPLLEPLGSVHVLRAAFQPGGQRLLLACDDGRARWWDVNVDAEIDPERALVHAGPVTALAFDALGERVLTGCRDGTARLWDGRTGRPLLEPMRHDAEVSAVAFSPDGRTLLTGSLDGSARFWDTSSGQPLGPTRWHDSSLRAVAFHPGGEHIAAAGNSGTLFWWHVPAPPREGTTPEAVRHWAESLSQMTLDVQGAVHSLQPGTTAATEMR